MDPPLHAGRDGGVRVLRVEGRRAGEQDVADDAHRPAGRTGGMWPLVDFKHTRYHRTCRTDAPPDPTPVEGNNEPSFCLTKT